MRSSLALAVAMLGQLACTVDNPLYVPAGGGGDMAGVIGVFDFATTHPDDFGMSMTAPDLLPPSQCMQGQRTCVANASAICVAGSVKTDRHCPADSSCSGGYCQPPPLGSGGLTGTPCSFASGPRENFCLGSTNTDSDSCQPFVTEPSSGGITWVCDVPVGSGSPGTSCNGGGDCRSGFCGSNGTCFRACADDSDCPVQTGGPNPGNTFTCQGVSILVEGQTVHAKSCIPTR